MIIQWAKSHNFQLRPLLLTLGRCLVDFSSPKLFFSRCLCLDPCPPNLFVVPDINERKVLMVDDCSPSKARRLRMMVVAATCGNSVFVTSSPCSIAIRDIMRLSQQASHTLKKGFKCMDVGNLFFAHSKIFS